MTKRRKGKTSGSTSLPVKHSIQNNRERGSERGQKMDEPATELTSSVAFEIPPPPPVVQDKDLARRAYQNTDNSFLLARTFRAGASNGVETELSYLQNSPGYIFVNPTTVISHKIASKTISQLPGNNWSGQPSLLFSIQPNKHATIAHHGLASLNSFSSTDAIALLFRQQIMQEKASQQKQPPKPIAVRFSELKIYLQEHWRDIIEKLRQEQDMLEGKPVKPMSGKDKKKFYKAFDLYFHAHSDYNELISSFQEFVDLLEGSNQLDKTTRDIALNRHPLAELFLQYKGIKPTQTPTLSEALEKTSHLYGPKNVRNKSKRIFLQAEGALKHEINMGQKGVEVDQHAEARNDIEVESVYERYASYLDTGARHNELVSRVYPWEISGVEWGSDEETQKKAITDINLTKELKATLLDEFEAQGLQHPLLADFMMNKLSLDNPGLNYEEVQHLLQKKMVEDTLELNTLLDEIKMQLKNPVDVYEYSPTSRELVNISELVSKPTLEDRASLYQKQQQCRKVFAEGQAAYDTKMAESTIIPPLSKVKKLPVRVTTPDLHAWFRFWELSAEDAEQAKIQILQQLSERVINQPYVDDSRELKDSKNNTIYRPNHDVMHSMRKLNYLPQLFQLVSDSKSEPWVRTLRKFTDEEKACLHLAVFLYRSGRTNEQGGSVDPTNAQRSAALFELAAKQLGFRDELINSMKHCFDFIRLAEQDKLETYQNSGHGFAGDKTEQQQKALLAWRLANMSHDMDLVRTNSWRSYFQTKDDLLEAKKIKPELKNFKFDLVDQMRLFFPNDAERHVDDLLLLAKKSCEATGTVVHCDQFSQAIKVSDYQEPIKDEKLIELFAQESLIEQIGSAPATETHTGGLLLKDVKSYFTTHVGDCDKVLKQVSHSVNAELEQQRNMIQQEVLNILFELASPKTAEEALHFTELLKAVERSGVIVVWDKIKDKVEKQLFGSSAYRTNSSLTELAKSIKLENLDQFKERLVESKGYKEYLNHQLFTRAFFPALDVVSLQASSRTENKELPSLEVEPNDELFDVPEISTTRLASPTSLPRGVVAIAGIFGTGIKVAQAAQVKQDKTDGLDNSPQVLGQ